MLLKETLSLISAFKLPIIEVVKELEDKVLFFLDNGLSEYIETMYGKYKRTKTFLFRNEEVPSYDIYFPISIIFNNIDYKVSTIDDLFKQNNFVTTIGSAGSGKSILMKHLFLTSINNLFKIPKVIELRALNDFNGTLTEYNYEAIFINRLTQ